MTGRAPTTARSTRKTDEGPVSLRAFRLRLLTLIILAFLPLFGLAILNAAEQRSLAEEQTKREALRLVRLFSTDQAQAIEGVRQLLVALSQLSEVRRKDGPACAAFLETLLRQYGRYARLGAADENGYVFCSVPEEAGANLSDQFWFNGVRSTNDFFGGEYQPGEAGRDVTQLYFGYPVRNAAGGVEGVVYAALDLSWLNRIIAQAELPERTTFFVVDHTGTILVHYPDTEAWIGKRFSETLLIRLILSRQNEGILEAQSIDGVVRLNAFMRLTDVPGAESFYAVVGIPKDVASATANRILQRNLTALGAITALALAAAWFFGNMLILRNVRALKELDRLKSEFVSLASHQLRTPLTAVSWNLDLVRSGQTGPVNADQKEFLDEAKRSAESLIALIRDLLNISRIEAGRLKVDPVPTDLIALAEDVLRDIEPSAQKKGVVLDIDFPATPLTLPIDPLLIRQVIMNLLSNAVKYTPKGGHVRVSLSGKGPDAFFAVADTGLGIPPDEQPRIFERFFRASNAREHDPEGTGLGLYLAKALVEMSGGRIGFESQAGRGTIFWFTLPLAGSEGREGEMRLNA